MKTVSGQQGTDWGGESRVCVVVQARPRAAPRQPGWEGWRGPATRRAPNRLVFSCARPRGRRQQQRSAPRGQVCEPLLQNFARPRVAGRARPRPGRGRGGLALRDRRAGGSRAPGHRARLKGAFSGCRFDKEQRGAARGTHVQGSRMLGECFGSQQDLQCFPACSLAHVCGAARIGCAAAGFSAPRAAGHLAATRAAAPRECARRGRRARGWARRPHFWWASLRFAAVRREDGPGRLVPLACGRERAGSRRKEFWYGARPRGRRRLGSTRRRSRRRCAHCRHAGARPGGRRIYAGAGPLGPPAWPKAHISACGPSPARGCRHSPAGLASRPSGCQACAGWRCAAAPAPAAAAREHRAR